MDQASDTRKLATQSRFCALWSRCSGSLDSAEAEQVYADLSVRYAEPQRHYHSMAHIEHCLAQFDLVCASMDDADAVELALWFHDAVYDVHADDNEARSAELYAQSARHSMDPELIRRITELIMMTVHPSQPIERDEKFIVDIDLSGFGLPWPEFKRDSDAVRREYSHQSNEQFFAKQQRFLQKLLDKPAFYITDFFYTNSERRARDNLRRYFAELKSQRLV